MTPSLFTAQQRTLIDLMRLRNNPIHVERLVEALYGDRPDGGPDHAVKVVRIQIGEIRRRLARHDIAILTIGGEQGYMVDPAHLARLSGLLAVALDEDVAIARRIQSVA